ncbi:MAG: class I tRNA ligase family protein, partial [Puniceicoccales bacterium]|nr:class I tRNA ligase family protein [Puniceicoccales bacterium]
MALGRNFCNKLWNAFRFSRIGRTCEPFSRTSLADIVSRIPAAGTDLDIDDHAILLGLIKFCDTFEKFFENFEINAAVNLISSFFWGEYCNWYLETSKVRMRSDNGTVFAVHDVVMRQLLLVLNPFIPFITEELWSAGDGGEKYSMQNIYCETATDLRLNFERLKLDGEATWKIVAFKELVNATRRLLSQVTTDRERTVLQILPKNADSMAAIASYLPKLKGLIGVERMEITEEILQLPSMQTPFGILFLGGGNPDPRNERAKIEDE